MAAKKKEGTTGTIRLVAIILGVLATLTSMTFAYATVVFDTNENTVDIAENTVAIDEHGDDIMDMKLLLNETLYYQSEIAETLKEIQINTQDNGVN